MTVELFEMDGLTRIVALDVPRVDDVPKVALWNDRMFLLLSAVHQGRKSTLSYIETLGLRLELPGLSAGAGQ